MEWGGGERKSFVLGVNFGAMSNKASWAVIIILLQIINLQFLGWDCLGSSWESKRRVIEPLWVANHAFYAPTKDGIVIFHEIPITFLVGERKNCHFQWKEILTIVCFFRYFELVWIKPTWRIILVRKVMKIWGMKLPSRQWIDFGSRIFDLSIIGLRK